MNDPFLGLFASAPGIVGSGLELQATQIQRE